MNIGLYARTIKEQDYSLYKNLFIALEHYGIQVYFHPVLAPYNERILGKRFVGNYLYINEEVSLQEQIDFLITIGGDGTLLDAILVVRDSNVPILGINAGNLGFLTSYGRLEILSIIEQIKAGNFSLDRRTLLCLESNNRLFENDNIALNECAIRRSDNASMVIVHTYIDEQFLTSYWADGLIIATPTGSTAYSLSCGGPVLMPHSNNFVITPVCPHNLNLRPMIVSNDSTITLRVEWRSSNFLCTLDARSAHFDSDTELKVHKNDYHVALVRPPHYDYLDVLRKKLLWGSDLRKR